MTTRFDGWQPFQCRVLLTALVALVFASLALSAHRAAPLAAAIPVSTTQVDRQQLTTSTRTDATAAASDIEVYQRITAAVAAGDTYYTAVAREHRLNNYPLKPFFTIRPPTLAWISAALGPTGTRVLITLLIGLTAMAWLRALRPLALPPLVQYAVFGLIAESAFVLSLSPYIYFHESWAALLIALSNALRRPDQFALSIMAGLAAVLVRELAVPFLVLMAALAVLEGSRREAVGWCAALVAAAVVQLLHANAVGSVVLPGDPASQGWNGFGGWSFLLHAVSKASLFELVPMWVTAVAVPLSLFGWIAWRSALALRISGLLLGYATLLMVFARPDNIYWALLIEPFLLAGVSLGVVGGWRLIQGSALRLLRPDAIAQ